MEKRVLVTRDNFRKVIEQASRVLKKGGVIAYPTETLYGLGALIDNPNAIERVRKIKAKKEPILVLVSGIKMAEKYVELKAEARRLMKHFWPGDLTLVLPALPGKGEELRAGSKGLGIRQSSEIFAQGLVEQVGVPITSTSANRSGKEPLKSAKEIEKELGAELDLIVDAGPRFSAGSTVVDLTGSELKIIREGVIKFEEVKRVYYGEDYAL